MSPVPSHDGSRGSMVSIIVEIDPAESQLSVDRILFLVETDSRRGPETFCFTRTKGRSRCTVGGDVTVGNNAVIGAYAFVCHDVSPATWFPVEIPIAVLRQLPLRQIPWPIRRRNHRPA